MPSFRTHPLHAALPHSEVGLLEVGDLDGAVAAVVVPVRLEPAVLVRVPLPLAAFYMSCINDDCPKTTFLFGSLTCRP